MDENERPIDEILSELARHSQRPMLIITRGDVVTAAAGRGVTEDEVDAHWRSFEKGAEWGLMDAVWDVIDTVATDIARERAHA